MSKINRVYYNKLIRDNVPIKIESKKEEFEVRKITDDQEFQQELFKKVKEEATALSMCRSKEKFLDEYSDLAIVLDTLIDKLGISEEELMKARQENLLKKGAYHEAFFLHWSEDTDYRSDESVQGVPS